jgi:hypothetical protein
VIHFFAVAVYGGLLLIFRDKFPYPSNILNAFRVLLAAARVMLPLL